MNKEEFVAGIQKRKAILFRHGMFEKPLLKTPVDTTRSKQNTKNSFKRKKTSSSFW